MEFVIIASAGIVASLVAASGFRVVRENQRGIVESGGNFKRFVKPGIVYALPFQKLHTVEIAEDVIRINAHPVVTKDNVTCLVDVNVYYKLSDIESSIRKIFYEVTDYKRQIENHIKSEILDAFALYTLKQIPTSKIQIIANARNNSISLSNYFTITNIEFSKIQYPEQIQQSINKIKAGENEKVAAKKTVEAEKLRADGIKRIQDEQLKETQAKIKMENEMRKKAVDEVAAKQQEAIKMVNEMIETSMKNVTVQAQKMFEDVRKQSERKILGNE